MRVPAVQLFGLLARHPELAPLYMDSLQHALLWGTSDDPGQSGVVRRCVLRASAPVVWPRWLAIA